MASRRNLQTAERVRGTFSFKGPSVTQRLELQTPREGGGAVWVWVLKQAWHLRAPVAQDFEWAGLTGIWDPQGQPSEWQRRPDGADLIKCGLLCCLCS